MAVTSQAERREFRGALRSFLQTGYPDLSTESRVELDSERDAAVWRRLVTELALPGLLVPEKHDGQGFGFTEAVIALEEAARVLLVAPLLSSSVLATYAVLASGEQSAGYLSALAGGELIASVATVDDPAVEVVATATGGGWTLTGRKVAVLDACRATHFVVSARSGDGVGLFLLPLGAAGLSVVANAPFDLTRDLASLDLTAVTAQRLGDDATAVLSTLGDVGAMAAAAELVGVAQRALEIAVSYALQREQFGHLIGSFQAVKHLCAEMLAAVESSRAAVTAAAAAADDDPSRLPEAASIAKAYCAENCTATIEKLIQVLGGIGFTWEHPAHLLLRRAKSLEALFGDAAAHRERIGQLLNLNPTASI